MAAVPAWLAGLVALLAAAEVHGRPLRTPPMGWSSWYAFGKDVNQAKMEATYQKLVNRSVLPGSSKSLKDAGYAFANIDDGWQACHAGVSGSFHSAEGMPLVDGAKFPDIAAMTDKAHSLGLRPGFYLNNYICAEGMPAGGIGGPTYMKNMRGNVDFLAKNGFDYLKVDSGSVYNDMQLWHDLINASGRSIVVENCHQGHLEPNATWCPFDLFRTSGDLHCVGLDVELLAAASVLELSRPGCWAYPDTIDPGYPEQVRSQLAGFAVMSAPLVLSFDILDDAKLLPIFDILTNEEAIAVDQNWAGSAGRLLKKWSPHLTTEPLYPWVEPCGAADPALTGWAYDGATVTWLPEGSGDPLCLAAPKYQEGPLTLEACSAGEGQSWVFEGGRLWRGDKRRLFGVAQPPGTLRLDKCNESQPSQQWKLSAAPGSSEPSTVQNDLPWRQGGCWEITACELGEHAQVDVNFGCKPVPLPGASDPCAYNAAWSFNSNGTITSVMDGKCLQVDPYDGDTVNVGTCSGALGQRWRVQGESIRSVALPDSCISSGIATPPPGTDGRCAVVQVTNDAGGAGAWPGFAGPAIKLDQSQNCAAGAPPRPTQAFSVGVDGHLHAGGLCVAARHGVPTPFGPLQLWAKPQPGGAVAVALLNRSPLWSEPIEVSVELTDLPGLEVGPSGRARLRDVWARADLTPVDGKGSFTVGVPGGDSRFFVLSPDPDDREDKFI